jgi:DNA polymerase-3 subunit epsilon
MKHIARLMEVVRRNNYIVLDTETTGIDSRAQIIQIAMIDSAGRVLIDSLIRPTCPIPAEVTAIHGLTDADVANAPTWKDQWLLIKAVSTYKDIIAYNSDFDIRLIRQTFAHTGIAEHWQMFNRGMGDVACAMRGYAEHHAGKIGQSGGRGMRWHSLSTACQQEKIPVQNAHNALADCRMTLALVKEIAAQRTAAQEKEPDGEHRN